MAVQLLIVLQKLTTLHRRPIHDPILGDNLLKQPILLKQGQVLLKLAVAQVRPIHNMRLQGSVRGNLQNLRKYLNTCSIGLWPLL